MTEFDQELQNRILSLEQEVVVTRHESKGNFARFFSKRLEYFLMPWGFDNPYYSSLYTNTESVMLHALIGLNTDENMLWEPAEHKKGLRVTAAFISVTQEELMEGGHEKLLKSDIDTVGFLFNQKSRVRLADDEAEALHAVLNIVGKEVDQDKRVFRRP